MELYKAYVPLKPPTINAIYQIIYSQRRYQLKPDILLFKTDLKRFLPPWTPPKDFILYELRIYFYGDWWFKNGKPKRQDLDNLGKVTQDAIAERLGFDDALIWVKRMEKIQAEKDGIDIRLFEYGKP